MKCVNLHINVRMAQFHEEYNAWGSEYTGVTKKNGFPVALLGMLATGHNKLRAAEDSHLLFMGNQNPFGQHCLVTWLQN